MLYKAIIEDGNVIFITEEEYLDFKKALDYMGVKIEAHIVTDKMYAIHWFDYIDDEWAIIWSTEEEFAGYMKDILTAEVEYRVEAYN